MLELIAKYALDEGLAARPGFNTKAVKWQISLDSQGHFTGVIQLGPVSDKKNPGLEIRECPEFPSNEMQAGGKAHPLVESLNVVALLGKTPEEDATEKDVAKHDFFVELLTKLAATLPEAQSCADALNNPEVLAQIQQELRAAKAKPTDKATVAVAGQRLVEHPAVAEWWIDQRKPADIQTTTPLSRCFVSGELSTPLATHPKIAGLAGVGGLAIGSSLISFDKGAFESFGLEQSANAAVSEAAAMQYRAGLNHLIASGKKLGPTIVAHWYSGQIPDAEDPLNFLFGGDDDTGDEISARIAMQNLLSSIQTGKKADLSRYQYFILTLSGSAGRVMLRDWQQGQLPGLAAAVSRWADDLEITASDGKTSIRTPKFLALAASTVREIDNLEAPMLTALWRSAFSGTAIPLVAVRGALTRTRIDILDAQLRPIRMALLKAFILRNTSHGDHMHPYLNPDHPKSAYQAGRLMAVMANIQYAALGDVNANIIQRFYPAASTTPALVFGRLTRQAQFHLNKIESKSTARDLEDSLAMIWGQIQEDLPRVFNLEQQTLFALGYYQQLAWDRAK